MFNECMTGSPAVPHDEDDFNHSSLQRASSLFQWPTNSDMRLGNTFMDEDNGWITTRDDWNTGSPSQIDFVISSSSLVCVDTGVDEHMDFATGSFTSQRQRLGNTRDVDSTRGCGLPA